MRCKRILRALRHPIRTWDFYHHVAFLKHLVYRHPEDPYFAARLRKEEATLCWFGRWMVARIYHVVWVKEWTDRK